MEIAVDTSTIIAVIANEPQRETLIQASAGADLVAPPSVHWEVGNAFSAMFKRDRITLEQALLAMKSYQAIPIRFAEIGIDRALELSKRFNVYAYDAYVIECALKQNCPLLSLDTDLLAVAEAAGAKVVELPT